MSVMVSEGERRRWYVVVVLLLIYASQYFDRQLVAVLAQPIKHEFAVTDSSLGILLGAAYGLPFALAVVPAGVLIDRINRRNLMAVAVMCWSLFTIFSGLARSFASLVWARAAVAIAEAPNTPTGVAMLSDLFGAERRATAVGMFYSGTAVGTVLAFAVGGWVAVHYGWRTAFFLGGAPGLAMAAILLATVAEPRRDQPGQPGMVPAILPAFWETMRHIGSDAVLRNLMAGLTLSSIAVSGHSMWMVSYLTRTYGISLNEAGLALGIGFGCSTGAGQALGGFVADWLAQGSIPRMCGFIACTTLAVFALMVASVLAPGAGLSIALIVLWGLPCGAQYGPVIGCCQSLVPPVMRGRTAAVALLLMNLIGAGFGPGLVGWLSDHLAYWTGAASLQMALIIVTGLNLMAASHFLLARQACRRCDALPDSTAECR